MLRRRPLTLALVALALSTTPLAAQFPVLFMGSAGASFNVDTREPVSGGGFAFLTGVGLRFHRVAFGGEFGQHALGGGRKARQYGGFLRLAAASGHRIEPYFIIGVADYRYSPSGTLTSWVGGSVGPGMTFSVLDPGIRVVLEGRFHTSLDRIGTISSQEFMTVALGLEIRP